MCIKVLDSLPLLLQKITDLEAECSSLKSDIRERDAKIHDRDQRISALKAKSQQLAKFKFVLEYKLDEVKGQLEPKEAEIEDLNKKIEVDVHFESQGSLEVCRSGQVVCAGGFEAKLSMTCIAACIIETPAISF